MADSDDDFMQDSDNEQYDFEYEDDDDDEGGDIDIENKYYNAKQLKVDEPEDAITEFLGVPALEPEKGDWYVNNMMMIMMMIVPDWLMSCHVGASRDSSRLSSWNLDLGDTTMPLNIIESCSPMSNQQ